MDKIKAYEILELSSDATTVEVKKKYENFMRLTKFDKSFDEVLITDAFDTIMGYKFGKVEKDPAYTAKGINKKKIDNFFYHYSRHLVYGSIALIVFGALFISIFSKQPKPDVGVMVLGNTYVSNQEQAEIFLAEKYNFEFIRVIGIPLTQTNDATLNDTNIFKLATVLQGGEADLIVADLNAIQFLAPEDALEDLSKHFEELGIKSDDERIVWLKGMNGEEIAAGINLGDYTDLDEFLSGDSLTYIAIADYTANTENAYKMFSEIISE
jgi:hypothetical protein